MKQIREYLHRLTGKVKESFNLYKITVAAAALAAFFSAVTYMLDYEFDVEIPFDSDVVLRVLIFFACSAFLTEVCFLERKIWKLAGFLVSALIAVGGAWCFELEDEVSVAWTTGGVVNEWAHRFLGGYLALAAVIALYICFRRSRIKFEEYLLKIFCGFCVVNVIFFGLELGMMLVVLVFDVLFLKGHANLNYAVAIILFGIYYVPACIVVLTNTRQRTEDFLRAMVRGLLSGMTICALAVVYLYFIKIVVMRQMPSNEIFGIVSGVFCFGMPVWIMAVCFDDDGKYSFILRILPYLFSPLILLQTYSMGIRIYEHGMTADRYLGVMLILFEIGVLLIWRFGREKLERILLLLCACIVVAAFLPGINMYSVSNRWQSAVLAQYYEKAENGGQLSEAEYERLKGAYEYLNLQSGTKDIVAAYDIYAEDFVSLLDGQEMNMEGMTKTETYSLHCCQMVGELDVSGYGQMDMLNQDTCYDTAYNEYLDVDFTQFRFVIRETGEVITVDIDDFAKRCIAYEKEHPDADQEEISQAMKPYQEIRIDEDSTLYMNHFQLKYSEGVKEGESFSGYCSMSISGILLRKQK